MTKTNPNKLVVVARRGRTLTHSEVALEVAIREARDAGYSLRAIAVAAGVSHTQVRRIIAK